MSVSDPATAIESPVRVRATARITVQSSDATPYDQTTSPVLSEIRLTEIFSGDIEGQSLVRALQVQRDDKSACLVSMQRFHGKLGARQGSFVLQGSETVESGRIKANGLWFLDRGPAIFPGYEAKAALKATLERALTDFWITGSNSVATARVANASF